MILLTAVHQVDFVFDAAAHAVVGIFLCAATVPGLKTAVDTDDGGAELMGTEAAAGRVGKPISTGIGSGVGAGFLQQLPQGIGEQFHVILICKCVISYFFYFKGFALFLQFLQNILGSI